MKLKVRRSLVEGNELENRAARHRKKQKGMSPFSYLNPDAGDVEKGIECFNHAVGAGEATNVGAAMGEGYFDDQGRAYKSEAISEDEGFTFNQEHGRGLGNFVDKIADKLEVGDIFTISKDNVPYICPGADKRDTHTISQDFIVTDKYRYGNGFAPIYCGRIPRLNSNQSRNWRDIVDGALWLSLDGLYTITTHKSNINIES